MNDDLNKKPMKFNLSSYFGDNLTFNVFSSNTDAVTVTLEGSELTLTGVSKGSATITVEANDGTDTVSQSFNVAVTNTAPNSIIIPNQSTKKTKTVTIDLTTYFKDIDEDALTFTAVSDKEEVIGTNVEGSKLTLTGMSKGVANITVSANDGIDTTTTTFVTNVLNTAPNYYSTIPTQSTKKNQTVSVDLMNYFSDIDGDTLTYTAASDNTGIVTVGLEGSVLTLTGASKGTATITVSAFDGTESTEITFTTNILNTAPVYTEIPTQSTRKAKTAVVDLSQHFSDVDGDVLTYTATSSEESVVTAEINGSILTLTGVSKGTAAITIVANDGTESVSKVFTTNILNTVPTFTQIETQSTRKNKEISIDLSKFFSDLDEDSLVYVASTSDDTTATTKVEGDILTLAGIAKGKATITVVANDGTDSATQTFEIDVLNTPPTFIQIPDQSVKKNETLTIDLANYFADID